MEAEHRVVSHEEWLASRKRHLEREKAFTRLRDELSRERRELPWEKVEKDYRFATIAGERSLTQLFEGRRQLIVYHFMYGPDWSEGCKSCSFWADNFNGIDIHLAHRDLALVAVSRAPLAKIEAFKRRMGWTFRWVSSFGSDFNRDFGVSFTPEESQGEVDYNYTRQKFPADEAPGMSLFFRDGDGTVFHTYSCYARGLDMLNGAYHILDLAPKGKLVAAAPLSEMNRRERYDDSQSQEVVGAEQCASIPGRSAWTCACNSVKTKGSRAQSGDIADTQRKENSDRKKRENEPDVVGRSGTFGDVDHVADHDDGGADPQHDAKTGMLRRDAVAVQDQRSNNEKVSDTTVAGKLEKTILINEIVE